MRRKTELKKEDGLLHKQLKNLLKETEGNAVKFKNYKIMCESLGLPVNSSNSKTAQLERLGYFCNLTKDKEGWGYSYTEVYDNPDQLMLQEDIITAEIEKILLLTFLMDTEEQPRELIISRYEAWKLFGFINDKFSNEYLEKEFKQKNAVSEKQLAWFQNKSKNRFDALLTKAFKKLKNLVLIEYFSTKIIVYEDENKQLRQREATTQEIQRAMKYQKQVLEKMGYNSYESICMQGKSKEYHSRVNNLINKNENWIRYLSAYRIIPNSKKWLAEGLQRNLESSKKYQLNVNKNVTEDLHRSGATTFNNYRLELIKEYGNRHWIEKDSFNIDAVDIKGLTIFQRKGDVLSEDYLDKFDKFIEEFIRI